MSDMKLSLIVEAIDKLSAPFRRMSEAVKGPAAAAKRAFGGLNEGLENLAGRYESLALAVGGGIEVKEIISDQDVFNRLRIQFDMTEQAAEHLQEGILKSAAAMGAPIGEMTAGLKSFTNAGGDVAAFGDQLQITAKYITLLGGHGADLGKVMADLQERLSIKGPEQLDRALAALYEQSIKVPDGFAGIVTALDQTAASAARLGWTGPQAVKQIGALYAVMAKGGGGGKAAGDLRAFLDTLADRKGEGKNRILPGLGIKLSQQDMVGDTLSVGPSEVMQGIIKTYLGKNGKTLIAEFLPPALREDLKPMFDELDKTGRATTLNAKLGIDGDPTKTLHDASEAAASMASQLSKLHADLLQIGDAILTGPIKFFADLMARFSRFTAIAITALGGLAILSIVGGWFRGAILAASSFWDVLVFGVGVLGRLATALRLGTMLMAAFDAVMMANPIGLVVAAVTLLAGAAFLIYKNWEPIKAFFTDLWDGIVEKIKWVTSHLPSLPTWLGGTGGGSPAAPSVPGASPLLGPPAPTAFGAAAASPGGKKTDVGGQIVLRFDNAPSGLRVTDAKSNTPSIDYLLHMGYAMGVP